MNDPIILFVKPKAISNADKKSLKSAGIVVVEVDDPNAVKLIRAHADLSSSEMLNAAVKAICATIQAKQ